MSDADAIKVLEDLNERIGTAEKNKDVRTLRKLLSDNLLFRRASGLITLKRQFLADAVKRKDSTERLDSKEIEVRIYDESTAVVTLVVHLKGIRDGNPVEGAYRNIRVFQREPQGWKLQMWFNTKIP